MLVTKCMDPHIQGISKAQSVTTAIEMFNTDGSCVPLRHHSPNQHPHARLPSGFSHIKSRVNKTREFIFVAEAPSLQSGCAVAEFSCMHWNSQKTSHDFCGPLRLWPWIWLRNRQIRNRHLLNTSVRWPDKINRV